MTTEELRESLFAAPKNGYNRITAEQLQSYRNSAFDQAVRNGVLQGKVMQLIRLNAIISE